MGRARAALVFAAAATSACSLFVSLDDLQDQTANVEDVDGSAIDVSVADVGSADVTTSTGTDAAVHDAGAPYCDVTARDADYCDDFDRADASATATWSFQNVDDGGSFALESTDVISAPNAVVITSATTVTDPTQRLGFQKTYSSAPNVVTIHFGVRFVDADSTANVHFFSVAFDRPSGSSYTLELARRGAVSTLIEGVPIDGGSNYVNHDLGGAFAGSDFLDVVMSVDFKAHHLTIRVGGTTVYDKPPMSGSAGHISESIGIAYYIGHSALPTTLQFDDFAVFHQ